MICLKGIWNNKFWLLLLLEIKFIDKIFKDLKILIDDEVVMVEDIVKCLSFFKIIIIVLCIEFVLII